MKKKLKDITIQDMIDVCTRYRNLPCYDCPLYRGICSEVPYIIKCDQDLDKEIDLNA